MRAQPWNRLNWSLEEWPRPTLALAQREIQREKDGWPLALPQILRMGSGGSCELTKEEAAAVSTGLKEAPSLKTKLEDLQAAAQESEKLKEEVAALQKRVKELEAAAPIDPEADKAAAEKCKNINEAAQEGNVAAVRHFLHIDPENVEKKGYNGMRPLAYAACYGHASVVELLLTEGASVDATDESGCTALQSAANSGQAAVVEKLISAGAKLEVVNNEGWTPLLDASANNRPAVVAALLKAGASMEATDGCGQTALHFAVDYGDEAVEVVEKLIAGGAKVDVANKFGGTPLVRAAQEGYVQVVQALLKGGASVELQDSDGNTALHWAAGSGHAAVVEKLRDAGAKVDVARKDGETPYDLAKKGNHQTVMDLFETSLIFLQHPAADPTQT